MTDIKQYIPEKSAWFRAVVSSIPVAGSALDHLLFDKADTIRMRNMETAITALSGEIKRLEDQSIDKEWFASEEALAAFKILSDNVSYEPDQKKINALGRLVASCGTFEHSKDSKKLSVLEHLSKLSSVQIRLLSIILNTHPQKKEFSSGGLKQTSTAIWISDIYSTIKNTQQFWDGQLILDQELEVLESLNTIRRVQLLVEGEAGFMFTAIGRHAATYIHSAGL